MSELLTLGRVRLASDGSAETAPPPAQPKRVALLAYLALMTGRAPLRRDLLLALFWPELGEEEGRRALRQALHYLRRSVGEDVLVTSGDELGVRESALRCDAVEFERLADSGQPAEALALYRGDFLDGFHVPEVSAEYEEWVERTRARLRRRAAAAAQTAAAAAEQAGDGERAVEWGRRGCELEPDQEAGWRRLMVLQERLGDGAGALRTYDELAQRLRREFDADPAPETAQLAGAIRASSRPAAEPVAPSQEPEATPLAIQPAPIPTGSKPAGPSRRFILTGLAVVLLGGGAFAAFQRAAERRDAPPLVAAGGALAPADRILVADFADGVGDTALAAAVTEAFRVDLTQSPLIRVLTPRQVRSTLARMERSSDLTLDDSLAREVAVREGVKAFVTGSLARVGGAYTVSVQIVSAERGEALAGYRETAADSSDLIGAVDRVSKRLRHRIGESLRELRAMPELQAVTTGSLSALRVYTEGKRSFYAGDRILALKGYDKAVTLDTGFAMAWLATANTYEALAEPGRANAALSHALANQDRLPYFERNILLAGHAYSEQDYERAIGAYTRLLERYPNDVRGLNNLALTLRDDRQYAKAESLFTRATEVDSTIPTIYYGVHSSQVDQGKFAEARRTLDLIARRFPDEQVQMAVEVQHAAAGQDWETAERRAEAYIAARQGDTLLLVDAFEAMAGIVMTQGRLAEAERQWHTQVALSAAAGSRSRHVFGVLQLAYLEFRYRNGATRSLALVDSALSTFSLDSVLRGDRPYDELARFYAKTDNLSRARVFLAAADSNDRALGRNLRADRSWTRGVLALAEGRAARAEVELRQAAETHTCPICPLPDLARAYQAAGDSQAAIAVLERYLSLPWLWRYEIDAVELGWTLQRLGELYQQRGNAEKAGVARTRLLRLWRRADPELGPVLAEMRARLR